MHNAYVGVNHEKGAKAKLPKTQDIYRKAGKKMEKWGFQGVYVGMLLVMILCWGSMFHPWF